MAMNLSSLMVASATMVGALYLAMPGDLDRPFSNAKVGGFASCDATGLGTAGCPTNPLMPGVCTGLFSYCTTAASGHTLLCLSNVGPACAVVPGCPEAHNQGTSTKCTVID